MKVTFHRAIDMAVDPIAAVEDVISARCDKILTSGAASTAMAGASTIRQMIGVGGDRIDIIAAAGLSEDNVLQLLEVEFARRPCKVAAVSKSCMHVCHVSSWVTKKCPECKEVHGSLRKAVPSPMKFRKTGIWMGSSKTNDDTTEFSAKQAARERIDVLLGLLKVDFD